MFAAAADMETSQLRDGFTLADWVNLPSKSEGWERTPEKKLEMTDWPHKECLSYVKKETLPSGTELVRGLYFYPPPAPSPAVFPNLSGPELIKGCVLAIVRVEAASSRSDFEPQRVGEERAAEFARPINQAMRERFTKKYGTSVGMESIPFWGPGSRWYQDAARWIPNAEIVSGYDVKGGHMPDEDALVFPPFVFVRGRMPLVQEWQANIIGRSHRDPAKEAALFRQAVAAAGVSAAISQRMGKLYEVDTALADRLEKQVEEMCKSHCLPKELPRPKKDDWGEPIVPLLQDWFRALQTADPAHRAAGLLVADRVLIAFGSVRPWDRFGDGQSSTPEQSKRRSDLQNLGATFEPAYGDASYHYVGNWLDQAKDLDRDSEGGTLALLTWMSSGNTCGAAAGSEAFRGVISEGETLLTKKIDAPTAAQVHFMVGDAYSDIVAIATGESGGNGEYDPTQYEAEAEADRTKALQHYRAGLAVDNTSDSAKDAWRQAWHLAAGLLPNERYVCFGD
jgi:hypothetical protein